MSTSQKNKAPIIPRISRRIRSELVAILPESVKSTTLAESSSYQYLQAKSNFYEQLGKMLTAKPLYTKEGPAQPVELALATSALTEEDVLPHTEHERYFSGAYLIMTNFLVELEKIDFDLDAVKKVLDFGCGSGKYIRLCRSLPGVDLVGTDMNPTCIDWCQQEIPGVEFHLNERTPPLSFLEDNSIDLAFAFSVFTHIPFDIQEDWLRELHRAMSPGGVFLCTVLSEWFVERMLTPEEQQKYKQDGQFTLLPSNERVSLSSKVTDQHDVFQSSTELARVFGKYFDIRRTVSMHSSSQDILVLQKRT